MPPKKKTSNRTLQQKLKNFFSKQKGQMAKIAQQTKKREAQMRKIMKTK